MMVLYAIKNPISTCSDYTYRIISGKVEKDDPF